MCLSFASSGLGGDANLCKSPRVVLSELNSFDKETRRGKEMLPLQFEIGLMTSRKDNAISLIPLVCSQENLQQRNVQLPASHPRKPDHPR